MVINSIDLQDNVSLRLAKLVEMKLIENYNKWWGDTVLNHSKCLSYGILKTKLEIEHYFIHLPNDSATAVCHFRSLNHTLPIEYGRFWGVERDIQICDLCFLNKLGGELHYLMESSYFEDQRRMYLSLVLSRHPYTLKFRTIMNTKELPLLIMLDKFCKEFLSTFKVIYSKISVPKKVNQYRILDISFDI